MSSTIALAVDHGGGGGLVSGIAPPAVMIKCGGDRTLFAGNVDGDVSSCSYSSIGKNSDDDDDSDEEEVESREKCGEEEDNCNVKNGSFDTIQALEEALPFRRGISRFYGGKSKSFTNLTHASPLSSIKEIVKPENAYTRKRRNLLASSILLSENKNSDDNSDERLSKRSCTSTNNISQRTSTFAFTVAMNNSANSNREKEYNPKNQFKQSQVKVSSLPSRRRSVTTLRSFSMADLQRYYSRIGK